LRLSQFSLSLININNLKATEVYKSKVAGMGANQFKQYSMVRANSNDGFVYSGTTKGPNGQDVIHILKTDDNLATVWSYYYEVSNVVSFNSTKICKTYDENGYFISGYLQVGSTNQALILRIDNSGAIIDNTAVNSHEGVFLDVEPTSDGGCIAVGFQSASMNLVSTTGRRGLIMKFNNTLNIDWSRVFHGSVRGTRDLFFPEIAENVTVVNSSITNNQDEYFVMGTITDLHLISPPTPPDTTNLHQGYYCRVDITGNLIYENTTSNAHIIYDCVYDNDRNSIFFVGKFEESFIGNPPAPIIGEINFTAGINLRVYSFEGVFVIPQPHSPMPYKIEIKGDDLYIFGYIRNFNLGGGASNIIEDLKIPYRCKVNKYTFNFSDFYMNHIDINRTMHYNGEEPGFLHSWNGISPLNYFADSCASFYTPEMGVIFEDENENIQWGMVGYYDTDLSIPNTSVFDLHLMTSLNSGECNPFLKEMEKFELSFESNESVNVPAFESLVKLVIQRNIMFLNETSCE
jgi:hypothetical protein